MATTTISKKEQAELDRQAYIKNAEIDLHVDYATVTSQSGEDSYTVQIVDDVAVSCNCSDFYYRGRKTGQACKHMEAAQLRLDASPLPLLNTQEAKELISDLSAIFKEKKVRRSAHRADVVASLQVAEGTKIRKARGQNCLVVPVPAPIVEEVASTTDPVTVESTTPVAAVDDARKQLEAEIDALLAEIEVENLPTTSPIVAPVPIPIPTSPKPEIVRGTLNGSRGFSLMRRSA